jgi:hypothetical protein
VRVTALTITRPYNGIGDWLFCLAVLKYVNRQRPDIDVYLDFQHVRVGRLPGIVPQLYEYADVRYIDGVGPADEMVTRDSLVYRRWPPDSFIESTVMHLNDQTGLDIRYEPGVLPSFGICHHGSAGTVVMIGHGKRRQRMGKEWGMENFQELARTLYCAGVKVVQIGSAVDLHLLRASRRVLGQDAGALLETLAEASLFVGIENGMTVLAGYLGVPQLTIYDGNGLPQRMQFARQTKIIERVEPDAVADRVLSMLKEGDRVDRAVSVRA